MTAIICKLIISFFNKVYFDPWHTGGEGKTVPLSVVNITRNSFQKLPCENNAWYCYLSRTKIEGNVNLFSEKKKIINEMSLYLGLVVR